ncbi:hypothetical protein [Chryseobacterium gossypii]|uniref:hypothetical protein n=1 Tax=Chryseobacterium gossypii TaxID=3231602 RepID=UPI0035267CAE
MEKRNADTISLKENWRLSVHLKICKWCRAYKEKLEVLDNILKQKFSREEISEFNDVDIQSFKDKIIRKFKD